MDLTTPISKLPSVGSIYKHRLEKLEIYTVSDFLSHFPFRYEDFSLIAKIASLQEGEIVTVQGKVLSMKNEYTWRRRFIQKAKVSDDTGTIDIVWFNQTFLTKLLPAETPVSLAGKIDLFKGVRSLVSPEYEIINPIATQDTTHTGRLVPIYPETYGVSSKWLRGKIKYLIPLCKKELREYLPGHVITQNDLISYSQAITSIHFPQTLDDANKARVRLSFDEFFLIQLRSLLRKREWEQKRVGMLLSISKYRQEISQFWQSLPFELTNAQKKAVKEIFADLAKNKSMNRLLEGDVGSGKTVVAAIGMYIAFLNGYQSVLMAPTEILANQHYDTILKLLEPLGVKVGIVTGGRKAVSGNEARIVRRSRKTPNVTDTRIVTDKRLTPYDILIGTHALLTESVKLDKLAFIVIDEQHRFGVEQRGLLLKKTGGKATPHILTMTATPIPRTVALTMYGNLDLSYLDEMPKGRIPVKTWVVPPFKRGNAYEWIKEKIETEGAQAFIICPFIEESETLKSVKAAKKEYDKLKENVFLKLRVGLLHGKMRAKEKVLVMEEFRNRQIDILVATPVVEVGIDIPGATIIMIEGADRFGLAQLHQLRGRVGRSSQKSFCLLFTDTESRFSLRRLASLEKIHVGRKLSELDLRLRGPGEITGTRQHGIPKLKIASFSDTDLIEKTRNQAIELLRSDPSLKNAPPLKEKLKTYTIKAIEPN